MSEGIGSVLVVALLAFVAVAAGSAGARIGWEIAGWWLK